MQSLYVRPGIQRLSEHAQDDDVLRLLEDLQEATSHYQVSL